MEVYMSSVWAAKGNFEVIIADNGSTDGSVEYIEKEFPKTRIVRNGENLGFAGANNRGAKHARGGILVFLNPDTSVEPDWLIELLKPFKDPTVGATTSKLLLMSDASKLNTCGNDVHISGLTLCRGMGQPRENFPVEEEVAAISGAAFAIRREIFQATGGFNESFFIYLEETALSLETRLRGWRCIYTPASVVHHDYALRFGSKKVLYQERNRYLTKIHFVRRAFQERSISDFSLILVKPALGHCRRPVLDVIRVRLELVSPVGAISRDDESPGHCFSQHECGK